MYLSLFWSINWDPNKQFVLLFHFLKSKPSNTFYDCYIMLFISSHYLKSQKREVQMNHKAINWRRLITDIKVNYTEWYFLFSKWLHAWANFDLTEIVATIDFESKNKTGSVWANKWVHESRNKIKYVIANALQLENGKLKNKSWTKKHKIKSKAKSQWQRITE